VTAQVGLPVNGHLDLGPLGGGRRERRQALCFAQVNVPKAGDYEFGVSADFWMEFWINGKSVLSTLANGNEGAYEITTHIIKAHFNQGANLLVARVLSGSGGWELVTGGPASVASARRAQSGVLDAAIVELKEGGKLLDHEAVPIQELPALAVQDNTTPADWATQAPDAVNGTVDNLFKAAPDEAHWYKGKDDLSARVWYRVKSDGSLLVEAAVRDDIDMPGDGIHLEAASGDAWSNRFKVSSGDAKVTRQRDETTKTTWYQVIVPQASLGVKPKERLALKVTIDDDDWGVLKQTTTTASGDNPETWFQGWIAP
jgi:hypothetical protein